MLFGKSYLTQSWLATAVDKSPLRSSSSMREMAYQAAFSRAAGHFALSLMKSELTERLVPTIERAHSMASRSKVQLQSREAAA